MNLTATELDIQRKIELNRKANPTSLPAKEWLETCGLSWMKLAAKFHCSESTIRNIFQKIGIANRGLKPARDPDSVIAKSEIVMPDSLTAQKRLRIKLLAQARSSGPERKLARMGLEELFGIRFVQG